jgi:hypothetical protein
MPDVLQNPLLVVVVVVVEVVPVELEPVEPPPVGLASGGKPLVVSIFNKAKLFTFLSPSYGLRSLHDKSITAKAVSPIRIQWIFIFCLFFNLILHPSQLNLEIHYNHKIPLSRVREQAVVFGNER